MPNNIYNILTIEAPSREALDVVLKQIKGRGKDPRSGADRCISFTRIVPHPHVNLQTTVKGSYGHDKPLWYEWNIERWGTKWDAYACQPPQIDSNTVVLRYDTANGSSAKVIYALSANYPGCTFTLECGEDMNQWHRVLVFTANDWNLIKAFDDGIGFGWTDDEAAQWLDPEILYPYRPEDLRFYANEAEYEAAIERRKGKVA
jgi:hypothetical protein